MMKKCIKRIILTIITVMSIFSIIETVNAVKIDMECLKEANLQIDLNGSEKNNSHNTNNSKSIKIKPGEEIWVSINVSDDEEEKVMALYGSLEYDKNILELVKADDVLITDESKKGKIEIGNGWEVANVTEESDDNTNIGNAKIMIYTTDQNRSSTGSYIKFKVKDNIKDRTASINMKDIVLYNVQYKETSTKAQPASLNIKIYQKSVVIAWVTVTVIIIILMLGIGAFICQKNAKKKEKEQSKSIENSEDKRDEIKIETSDLEEDNDKEQNNGNDVDE